MASFSPRLHHSISILQSSLLWISLLFRVFSHAYICPTQITRSSRDGYNKQCRNWLFNDGSFCVHGKNFKKPHDFGRIPRRKLTARMSQVDVSWRVDMNQTESEGAVMGEDRLDAFLSWSAESLKEHEIINSAASMPQVDVTWEDTTQTQNRIKEDTIETLHSSLTDPSRFLEISDTLDTENSFQELNVLHSIEAFSETDLDLLDALSEDDTIKNKSTSLSSDIGNNDFIMVEEAKEPALKLLPDADRDIWFARVLLLAAAALYGTNFTLVKILDQSMPVGASTALRFGIAGLITLPWFLPKFHFNQKQSHKNAPEKELSISIDTVNGFYLDDEALKRFMDVSLAGLEIGFWVSIGYIAQALGLETVDASKSAFICSLAVVFVPILDSLTGKIPSSKNMIGAALAVAGVGVLEFGGSSSVPSSASIVSNGDLLSLIQPVAFGMGFWRMESAMRRFPTEATRLTAAQLLGVGTVSVICCALGVGGNAPPSHDEIMGWLMDPNILGALLWTGCITTALTIYMETIAMKTLSAAETTLIFSTEPIWASLFAAVMMGERFGLSAATGAALIIGGCVFSNLKLGEDDH